MRSRVLCVFAQRVSNELLVDTDDRSFVETLGDAGKSALMGLLVSGIVQTADTVGQGGLHTPAQAAEQAAESVMEQIRGQTAGTEYRAEKPQNVELPTVPIINLSMQDVADLNGGVIPEAGNALRSTAINRTKSRLGLDETSEVYIPASNVTRNGEEYVLKITRSSLNKMLSPSNGGVVAPESIAVLENIERIANNGVYFRSEGDRQGRDQIAGYDHLMTTVYIDNQPYSVDMRVRVYDAPSGGENRLYYFTPEEIVTTKKIGTDFPTGTLRERTMSQETAPISNTTVPQRVPGVKKQSMQNGAGVSARSAVPFAGSGLNQRIAETETEYNAAIAQAEYTGEYQLAVALYEEKLRVQDALTEAEIHRLQNELEQYQLRHQTGQAVKPERQTGQQLSVGQIGKEYDTAIAQAQQNGEYELVDALYEEKLQAQEAAQMEDMSAMRKSVTRKDDERRGLPICIATVEFSDNKAVMRQLKQAEEESINLDYEINVSVTADGKVWRVSGESSTVKLDLIPSDIQGSYAYHNHPKDKTWYSFSADDAAFFISHGEAYSKASDNLYEYVMRRRKDTLAGDFDAVYNRFKAIEKTDVLEMKWNGLIDPDYDGYHETMKILSKEYRFDYTRRKKDGRQ